MTTDILSNLIIPTQLGQRSQKYIERKISFLKCGPEQEDSKDARKLLICNIYGKQEPRDLWAIYRTENLWKKLTPPLLVKLNLGSWQESYCGERIYGPAA